MSESLKEKAKTAQEWYISLTWKEFWDVKLVRLEDAQQEIDIVTASLKVSQEDRWRLGQEVLGSTAEIQRLERERGLLKQKLQQFEEFLVAWIENDIEKKKTHYYPSQDLDLVLNFYFELKELLK